VTHERTAQVIDWARTMQTLAGNGLAFTADSCSGALP
jgi:hypothetical protein